MRFCEFAPPLKISQTAQTNSTQPPPVGVGAKPPATKVYSPEHLHAWLQKYLANQAAIGARTIKPTADDMAIAFTKFSQVQKKADQTYQANKSKFRI